MALAMNASDDLGDRASDSDSEVSMCQALRLVSESD
jgi:hypothetical protein